LKTRSPASTHKKVIIVLADRKNLRGYLNPSRLGENAPIDLLTPDGEHQEIPLAKVRSIYFVREFSNDFEPERKSFLSRPKLDGLWVRLRFIVPRLALSELTVLGVVGVARRKPPAATTTQPRLFTD
jgi:hypothetical protein